MITKRRRKPSNKSKNIVEPNDAPLAEVRDVCLKEFTQSSLLSYGSEVVEERAIPDYRDGLKPVHRALLWSMYKLGLKYTSGYKKAARTVGDTIGMYHPHGDCLAADTRFLLYDGTRPTIKELFDAGKDVEVLSYCEDTKSYVPAVAHSFRVGQETTEIYSILLDNGSYIECTSNHQFLTGSGWVASSELEEGTQIVGGDVEYPIGLPHVSGIINGSEAPRVSMVATCFSAFKVKMYDFTVDKYENACILPDVNIDIVVVAHNSAAYGAMVTIANTRPNLVDGSGNWGTVTDSAAAQRYTEARLSQFSCEVLLDPSYLAVTPMVRNFSNDENIPLFLPAKLPVQLLIGSPTVPAYGVSAGNPPFAIDGVVKLVKLSLSRNVTAKDCLKHLTPNFSYGGVCVSSKEELLSFFDTGKGSLTYMPDIDVLFDAREIHISSYCPGGFSSVSSVDSKLSKLATLDSVSKVSDASGKGMGKYNVCYKIVLKRNSSIDEFEQTLDKVRKILTMKDSYDIGYTIRKSGSAKFGRMSVVQFFNNWTKYRVRLELNVLNNLIGKQNIEIDRLSRLVFAVDNHDDILQALKSKDPHGYLVRKWKKPDDFVKKILDLQLRRLAVIEKSDLNKSIRECKAVIRELRHEEKNPQLRIQKQLTTSIQAYTKKTSDKL